MDSVKATVKIKGDVQGVGFRHFTVQNAKRLEVNGDVENQMDGSVKVIAEGPKQQVEALIDVLKEGPHAAHVNDIDVQFDEATEGYSGFKVKY
jgi:acylphosphatase